MTVILFTLKEELLLVLLKLMVTVAMVMVRMLMAVYAAAFFSIFTN
jgi:hypothetical protein